MEEHRSAEGRTTVAARTAHREEDDASTRAERARANAGGRRRRAAILDSDSGFLLVLGKRLERAGWRYDVLREEDLPPDNELSWTSTRWSSTWSCSGPNG
jgi:hypothetical protein